MRFRDLSVTGKIAGAFGCILMVTIALGLFAAKSLTAVDTGGDEIRNNWMPAIGNLGRFEYFETHGRVFQGNYIMATTD